MCARRLAAAPKLQTKAGVFRSAYTLSARSLVEPRGLTDSWVMSPSAIRRGDARLRLEATRPSGRRSSG